MSAMTPTGRAAENRARVAALAAGGMRPAAIAEEVSLSERQVRRVLAKLRKPSPQAAPVELPVIDLTALSAREEVASAYAAHLYAERELRALAAQTPHDAVKVGALKASAALASERIQVLGWLGLLPADPAVSWTGAAQMKQLMSAIVNAAVETGGDVTALRECVREVEGRLRTEMRLVA
jgi:hypothetical protein